MKKTWDDIRSFRYSTMDPPPNWPSGVRPISQEGMALSRDKTLQPISSSGTVKEISGPAGSCPGVLYNLGGSVRGPRVVFRTSRNWTPDCNVTTNWSGHFVSPTTVVAKRGALRSPGRKVRGTEVFQRI